MTSWPDAFITVAMIGFLFAPAIIMAWRKKK